MTFTAFDSINPRSQRLNSKSNKYCSNNTILKYICFTPIFLNLLLLLFSSIYTNVILQTFLLEVNKKIGAYDVKRMTELYYNVSHNAYIMCINYPLITNPSLCHLS